MGKTPVSMPAVKTTMSTSLRITLALSMITAFCVGTVLAVFLVTLAQPESEIRVLAAAQPQPVTFTQTEDRLSDSILIKHSGVLTTEQSDMLKLILQSPIEVSYDPETNKVISIDPNSPDGVGTSVVPNKEIRGINITSEEKLFNGIVVNNRQPSSEVGNQSPTAQTRVASELSKWYQYTFDNQTDISQLAQAVQLLPFIEKAQTVGQVVLHIVDPSPVRDDIIIEPVVPNDYYFDTELQWALKNTRFDYAWNVSTGEQVVVAVIDSGVDATHPELDGQMWVNTDEIPDNNIDDDTNGYIDDVRGWDFNASSTSTLKEDNDPADDLGHGTFVSGIIAAKTNNAQGMAGTCWQCRIMPVKAFYNGGAYDIHIAQAIVYAVDNGAAVINMSFGTEGRRPLIQDAIRYAHDNGVVLVASAGNGATDLTNISPASLNEVISVGAVDAAGTLAWFSNIGASLDMVAPGVDVLSLRATGTDMYQDGAHIVDGAYYRANGTSFSSPHVSGLAALVLSQYPDATPEIVRAYLRAGSSDVTQAGMDCSGYSLYECQQHTGCAYNTETEVCSLPDCTSIVDSNMCNGTALCEKNFFLEACRYSTQIADWYDVQLPYAAGHDVFTGFGMLDAAASLTSEPPIYGQLLEPIRATHLNSNTDYILSGTVGGDQFSGYALEVKPRDQEGSWVTIAESTSATPIERGVLGTWHTPAIGEWYLVRLTTFGSVGAAVVTTEPYKVESRQFLDDVQVYADEMTDMDHGSVIGWGKANMGIVFGDGPDEVKFVRSADRGKTFSPPVLVGSGNLSGLNYRFPSMAAYLGNTIYISWSEFVLDGDAYHHRLYLSRSMDNGVSFGTPTLAVDHIYGSDHIWEQPYLAIDEQGRIFIASIDARAYSNPEIQPQLPRLYYVSSTDGGATFGAETTVTTDFDISANKSISAAARGGVLHIAFARGIQENGGYAKRIYYTASNRLTQEPIVMPRGNANGFYAFGPNLAIGVDGTIAVAWTEMWGYHATDSYVAVSANGMNFSSPAALAQSNGVGPFSYYPYLKFAPAGTLYAAWVEYTEYEWGWPLLKSTVQLSRSFDRGQTFSAPEQLSDISVEKAETVSLATVGTTLYAAWAQYDSENLFHIYADVTTTCGESCSSAQPYCNTTNGQCEAKCSDGTPFGTCARVSQYCNNSGTLVSSCFLCGCQSGFTCQKAAGYPGGKCLGPAPAPLPIKD